MTAAACEPPQKETVDRAKSDFARLGAFPQPGDRVEQPAYLRGGKVGVDDQPGALRHMIGESRFVPALAQLGCPPVLPYDRIMDCADDCALP